MILRMFLEGYFENTLSALLNSRSVRFQTLSIPLDDLEYLQ